MAEQLAKKWGGGAGGGVSVYTIGLSCLFMRTMTEGGFMLQLPDMKPGCARRAYYNQLGRAPLRIEQHVPAHFNDHLGH